MHDAIQDEISNPRRSEDSYRIEKTRKEKQPNGSEVVLFLDETSHNLRFISGPFPLSNSRCRGKVGVDAMSGTARLTTAVRNNVKPATPFER